MKKARFPIGLTFTYRQGKKGKSRRIITDIWTTTNSKGEVMSIEYETTYTFCGQSMKELQNDVAIARSLTPEELAKYL